MKNTVKRSSSLAPILMGLGLPFLAAAILMRFAFAGEEAAFSVIMPLAFGGIGLLVSILGISVLVKSVKLKAARKRLLETGSRLSAEVVEIARKSYTINNEHPYYIICRHIENGKAYVFESGSFMNNPAAYITDNRVTVWVNKNDFRDYYVDIEALFGGG